MDNELSIETRIGVFKKTNNYIGEVTFMGTNDATIEEAKEFISKMNEIMGFKPYYLVNFLTNDLGSFPPEIWNYLGTDKDHNLYIEGSVTVVENMSYRMHVNEFFKKYKPSYPKHIVDTKQQAFDWIEKIKSFISQ